MSNWKAKVRTDIPGHTVTWEWRTGQTDAVDLDQFPQEIVHQLALYGMRQKLSDAYSQYPIASEARAQFLKLLDSLERGEWTQSGGRVSILARALAKVKQIPLDDAIAAIAKLDKSEKAKIRKMRSIKLAMLEIQRADAEQSGGDDDQDFLDDIL